jgi:hypothetical protein
LSCIEGVSEEEYCGKNPDTIGCEETAFDTKDTEDQPAVPCCMGLVAECLSCSAGLTVQEYCGKNPDTSGCEEIAFETDADPVQDP